ncbi:MAG: response regulator [Lachnospiraceae bacterium]|nr:response regulator [Lachnospiraceae bacterium]
MDPYILVIDDININLEIMKMALRSLGVTAGLADSGEKGLEILDDRDECILVYTDLHMPDMDGKGVLSEVKKRNKDIPVICITAADNKDELIKEGFDGVLVKPVDINKLSEQIKKFTGIDVNNDAEFDNNEIRRTFYKHLKDRIEELTTSYEKGDHDFYHIKVHGLKSVLHHVGEEGLSREAVELEHYGDLAAAADAHRHFIKGLEELYTTLKEEFGKDEIPESEKKPISREEMTEAYKSLMEMAMTYDYDNLTLILDELEGYHLEGEDAERIKKIKHHADLLSWKEIIAETKKAME